jgi:hypothetical protein
VVLEDLENPETLEALEVLVPEDLEALEVDRL